MRDGTTSANSFRCNEGQEHLKQQPLLFLVIASWLIPGWGHLLANRKRTGINILIIVNSLWIAGMLISEFEAGSRLFHPWLFWAGAGCGGTALVSFIDPAAEHALFGLQSIREYQDVPKWNDTGVLLVCVAGLLNILCLLDVIDSRLSQSRRSESTHNAEEKQ